MEAISTILRNRYFSSSQHRQSISQTNLVVSWGRRQELRTIAAAKGTNKVTFLKRFEKHLRNETKRNEMAGPQNESAETAQQQSNRANAGEKKKRLSKIQRVRNWIRKFFI